MKKIVRGLVAIAFGLTMVNTVSAVWPPSTATENNASAQVGGSEIIKMHTETAATLEKLNVEERKLAEIVQRLDEDERKIREISQRNGHTSVVPKTME
jgi:hypothetical protein